MLNDSHLAFDSDEDIDRLDAFANGESIKIKDRENGYVINAKVFRRYIASLINEEEQFYLFLDEVQLLDNFVGTLNSYLRHHNLDLYATGSNSRFLSADIATEFKGRSCELHVQPLTFSEYVNGTGQEIRQAWANYIVTGGIPLVASMGDEQQQIQYLKNLTVETYLKDIIQRNGVRKKQELSDTFDILASVIASPVNPSKIANTFASLGHGEITSETIDRLSAISMELPEKQEQEKKSLYYIDDSFKKIVVTRNGLNVMRDEKGITTIDLFDFLMNEDSLDY